MDIDLFSEMVKTLILDNDEVTLPGLGTFVSEVMPSVFSDKGYTINPPYRKLSFRQRGNGNESMLADFYAGANGTDSVTAGRILDEFISGLRTTLQSKKIVVFPGLGRLRATKENAFFFIADEDMDIYPYGVGLEPVSLKTHEETPEEVTVNVAALRELAGPVLVDEQPHASVEEQTAVLPAESSVEPSVEVPAEPSRENLSPSEPVQNRRVGNVWRTIALVVIFAVALAALALGIFVLLAHVAPDFIDSVLYSPEELRIINY